MKYLHFRFPGLDNVHCLFLTRLCGDFSFGNGAQDCDVLAARRAVAEDMRSYGLQGWSELHQVHGVEMLFEPAATPDAPGPRPPADGQAASSAGLGLMIKTADCQPVFLAHKSGRCVAALHIGWRGNRQNFPGLAVVAFCRHYNFAPQDLLAVRGPSLGLAEFVNFSSEWGADFAPWYDPATRRMDLWGLTVSQLRAAGLPERNIYGLDFCTATNTELFFSYRRDRACGRQASLIWMNE